jgi:predicted SAM-dependent methyltransferase
MKLDIGASYNTHRAGPGWICMDINNADILQDLSKFPWDIKSSSVDAINASHILEHLLKDNAYKFLNECNRILVPGGAISISVPNMDNFINYHLYNDKSFVGDYTKTDLNLNLGGVHEFTDPWQH